MLVLTRKLGESFVIGEGESAVKVVLVQIRGRQVRLGIKAPDGVKIDRTEMSQEQAAKISGRTLETLKEK